jgi:hypothetical protein
VIRDLQGVAQGVHVMAIGGEAEVPAISRGGRSALKPAAGRKVSLGPP